MLPSTAPHLAAGLQIAVVGPGDGVTPELARLAEEVGRRLAEAGCAVVTGGGGGVMAAAATGAAAVGGIVIGLLPGSDRAAAVGPLTVAVPTGLGELRNGLIVRSADVLIVVGGSWGTASEVAMAMRTGIPVVAIAGWHFTSASGTEMNVDRADSPADAVAFALAAARPMPG